MQNGFSNIWEELNNVDDEKSLYLLELARFNKEDGFLQNFIDHHNRHKSYYVNGKEYTMSPEEYDDAADSLSSFPGISFGTGTAEDVVGYITQSNKKVKLIEIPGGAFMVAYKGDDKMGTVDTFYYSNMNNFIFKANPYHKLRPGDEDNRYKSDLDGRFVGLNYFKPILRGNRAVTQSEANQIKSDILNGDPISIR